MWNDEAAKRLGDTVAELRKAKKISQETLAHDAGITKNQIQLIEAGRSSARKSGVGPSNPVLSTLVGIASVFDLSAAQLLERAGI